MAQARARGGATLRRSLRASLLDLAPHEFVRPVVAFERPVLFVVLKVASGVERIDGAGRKNAVVDRLDLDLERALSSEHGLDPCEASAPEQAREPEVDAVQRVFGERDLRLPELGPRNVDTGRELARFRRVGAQELGEIVS